MLIVDLKILQVSFDTGTVNTPPKSIQNFTIMNYPSIFLQFDKGFLNSCAELLKRKSAIVFVLQMIKSKFCASDHGLLCSVPAVSIAKGNDIRSSIATTQKWTYVCVCIQGLIYMSPNPLMNCMGFYLKLVSS